MNQRLFSWLNVCALALLLSGVTSTVVADDAANHSGTWDLKIETDDGQTLEMALTINKGEDEYTGSFVGSDGTEVTPDSVTVDGSNVAFQVTVDLGGSELVAKFDGQIEDGKYTGNVEYDLGGQVGELAFAGQLRQKSLAVGTWSIQIDTGDGQILESTLTLTDADGELGGNFVAMDGSEVKPEDVKAEGNGLAFKITLDFGGTELVATFDGKIEEDKIAGSVEYDLGGQVGEATFEGARKVNPAIGTWSVQIDTGDGQVLESTLTLAEVDGELGGNFVAMDGSEVKPEDVKTEGDGLAFKITLDFGGTELVATFDGKIEEDKIAGSVEYDLGGQVGEATFTAARKASAAIGTWDIKIDTGDGQVLESTLTLAEVDGELGGNFVAMDGSEVKPEDVKAEGDGLAFKITLDFGGTELVATFDGKIEEDKIAGSVEYDLGGQVGEATFEGARASADADDDAADADDADADDDAADADDSDDK